MQVKFNHINFKRKLRQNEQQDAQNAMTSALKHLDKEFGIIFPDSMAPNDYDSGMNTMSGLYSQNLLLSFLLQNGIKLDTIQDLPTGLRKKTDNSPYVINSMTNDLFKIDLKSLTTEEYGKILSKKTFDNILRQNKKNNPYENNFLFAIKNRDKIQKEIFETFIEKSNNLSKLNNKEKIAILSLQKDFEAIKKEKGELLERFALYDILTKIHKNDYYPNWDNEIDKNLFDNNYDLSKRNKRLNYLKNTHKKEINAFIFAQLLSEKFIQNKVKNLKKNGICLYNDIPIAFSEIEAWANPNAFLQDKCLDANDTRIHHWNFRCPDYTQFFNEDDTLGMGGKILFEKYKNGFEKYSYGARIDHVMGLINPWICDKNDANIGSRAYEEYFKENQYKILTKIILPAAKAANIDTKNIIAEDVGYFTEKEMAILKNLNCTSVNLTTHRNHEKVMAAKPDTVAMTGSHDNIPISSQEQNKMPEDEKHNWVKIKNNVKERFIDLFTCPSKKVQVFITDLLGMRISMKSMHETNPKDRWNIRLIPDTFNKHYQEAIQDNMGFNMPEILLEACKRKIPDFEIKMPILAKKLKNYSEILKEKE